MAREGRVESRFEVTEKALTVKSSVVKRCQSQEQLFDESLLVRLWWLDGSGT